VTKTQDLLFELGCEELPPKNLLSLSKALLNNVVLALDAAGLSYASCQDYASPRRLAILISGLNTTQTDTVVEKRGPAIKAAFTADGTPSRAALGFAKSCGTEFENLERMQTAKGEWLLFKQTVAGKHTSTLIPEIINTSIHKLPIAKKMRWGNSTIEFVRPVHWALLLYGTEVISTKILGLQTSNQTRGHRFHAPEQITIETPAKYLATLRTQGQVIADFQTRQEIIRQAAETAAASVNGFAHIEADLLVEITALNEQPVPVLGNFDARFLKLPKEVLITTMQSNQKYFPVVNAAGDLLAHFITFSNITSIKPKSVQTGNERVILPRLADAEFFWNQDRQQALVTRVDKLNSIIFQQQLGSLADKTVRLQTLADYIATKVNADSNLAQRAALLSKADLSTNMVSEFASLQGIMGGYYALADGENSAVAQALEEQYWPKQSGTPVPASIVGACLSIADKIDTLTGIFSAGLIPTGDKDPYALRRASLGILRIIIEHKLPLDIVALIEVALTQYKHAFARDKIQALVTAFIFERLKGYCLEQGFKADEFEAVFACKPRNPLDFIQRLQAVQAFRQLPEAESLAAANKRIANILKKSTGNLTTDVSGLIEPAELELLAVAQKSAIAIKPLLAQANYAAALSELAQLKAVVDNFFDNVMVLCEDLTLRAHRLALLNLLAQQFLQIADIAKLQPNK